MDTTLLITLGVVIYFGVLIWFFVGAESYEVEDI